jgi:hypothetical protein
MITTISTKATAARNANTTATRRGHTATAIMIGENDIEIEIEIGIGIKSGGTDETAMGIKRWIGTGIGA